MSVLYHLAAQRDALVILLQETHCTSAQRLVLPDYNLAGFSLSRKHGLAAFVHKRLRWALFVQSPPTSETEWLCVDVDGYKIVNVYKPPPILLQTSDLPAIPNPCLYAGDFNCHHVDWVYDANSADGECLVGWANTNNLALLHNPKDAASFHSGRWNTITNPDLAFVSIVLDRCLPDRHASEKFSRSQHRPSLITSLKFARPALSKPVKRWNFRKAKWSHYITLTNKLARTLRPPDTPDVDHAYGGRNICIPCWDAECENLYQTFLQYPEGHEFNRAATALLARLDRKRRNRWFEAVQNIDFSYSSRVACSTLNNHTVRSRQCSRPMSRFSKCYC